MLNSVRKDDFWVIVILCQNLVQMMRGMALLTCNPAASSHTSLLFEKISQPCFMSFRAATILPACSSKRAAAIDPGDWDSTL